MGLIVDRVIRFDERSRISYVSPPSVRDVPPPCEELDIVVVLSFARVLLSKVEAVEVADDLEYSVSFSLTRGLLKDD